MSISVLPGCFLKPSECKKNNPLNSVLNSLANRENSYACA